METYIKKFSDIRIGDVALVGGKNALLGELHNKLVPAGIHAPDGFAVNVTAFNYFLNYNQIEAELNMLLSVLDRKDYSNLEHTGSRARKLIMGAKFPPRVENAIIKAYNECFDNDQEVAVRSSATAEDSTNETFVGQHDSFLNISGPLALIYAVKCCYASLYSEKAIKYREENEFEHDKVFISVGVQRMVRSDIACSGIGFTRRYLFTDEAIYLKGNWGLGGYIGQGVVVPDEFIISKSDLLKGKLLIIKKTLGSKGRMLIYNDNAAGTNSTLDKITLGELRQLFVLSDEEVEQLARWAILIERHYGVPTDFDWAKDGINQQLYIVQVRSGVYDLKDDTLHRKTNCID